MNPAGGASNQFGSHSQYGDGLNTYQYVGAVPVVSRDPFGLKKVCCKINTTYTHNPIMSGPGRSTWTNCTQVTVEADENVKPGTACCEYAKKHKAHYLISYSSKAYGWHEGECCWCTVEWRGVRSQSAGIPLHFWLIIRCAKDRYGEDHSFILTIFQGSGGFIVGEIDSDDRVDTGILLQATKISCSTAQVFKYAFRWGGDETRFWTGGVCLGNTAAAFSLFQSQCP